MPQKITIIGDGAMAIVMGLLLESRGNDVTIWGAFPDHVAQLIQNREDRQRLPGHSIPDSIRLISDDRQAFRDAQLIVSAVPTQYMRDVWVRLAPHLPAHTPIVSVAKGIETATLLRPTQIIAQVLDHAEKSPSPTTPKPRPLGALSGPSVAEELARCLPATVCAASVDEGFARLVQQTFTTQWFSRLHQHRDLLGVELAGAHQERSCLGSRRSRRAAGGQQRQIRSLLLSRGLAEMDLAWAWPWAAARDTFFGITGVGDLITTCFSPTGRNRTCGEQLGKGMKLQDVLLTGMPGVVVEGAHHPGGSRCTAKQHGVDMPITQAVYHVLFEGLDPVQAISRLMSREPKSEREGS